MINMSMICRKALKKAFHVFLLATFSSWVLCLRFALVMVWQLLKYLCFVTLFFLCFLLIFLNKSFLLRGRFSIWHVFRLVVQILLFFEIILLFFKFLSCSLILALEYYPYFGIWYFIFCILILFSMCFTLPEFPFSE